ncbi:MAG: LysM peptidoglycan-binding domain-containing protein [Pseudomonadota bacterium]
MKRAAIIAVLCGIGLLAAMQATGRLELVTRLVWHPETDGGDVSESVAAAGAGTEAVVTSSSEEGVSAPGPTTDDTTTDQSGADASTSRDPSPDAVASAAAGAADGADSEARPAGADVVDAEGETAEEGVADAGPTAAAGDAALATTSVARPASGGAAATGSGLRQPGRPSDASIGSSAVASGGFAPSSLGPSSIGGSAAGGLAAPQGIAAENLGLVSPSAETGIGAALEARPDGEVPVLGDGGSAALAALDPATTEIAPPTGGAAPDRGASDDTAAPRFDVVRVAPDGMAVIAGQAPPGARVELLIDGQALTATEADENGSFAIVTDIGSTEVPRSLQLRLGEHATSDNEPLQGDAIRVAVIESAPSAREGLLHSGEPEALTGAETATDEARPTPEGAPLLPSAAGTGGLSAPVVLLPRLDDGAGGGTGEGAAPTAVRAGSERVALVAPGATSVPRLVIDTLSYVEGKDGTAIGRAPGGAIIRVFVNNARATQTRASGQGDWTARVPAAMMRQAELLRFEQIDESGAVVYRLETRFSYRENGATLALRERTITVEKGDSLWRLAENVYGDGLRYSVIFGANDGLIRDPDLIYPEQEFVIPELVDEGAADR